VGEKICAVKRSDFHRRRIGHNPARVPFSGRSINMTQWLTTTRR